MQNIEFSDSRVELDELRYDLEQSEVEDEDLFSMHVEEQIDEAKFKMIFGG